MRVVFLNVIHYALTVEKSCNFLQTSSLRVTAKHKQQRPSFIFCLLFYLSGLLTFYFLFCGNYLTKQANNLQKNKLPPPLNNLRFGLKKNNTIKLTRVKCVCFVVSVTTKVSCFSSVDWVWSTFDSAAGGRARGYVDAHQLNLLHATWNVQLIGIRGSKQPIRAHIKRLNGKGRGHESRWEELLERSTERK